MKYVFIEKYQIEFLASKPCVVCFGLPAAAGMPGVCVDISSDRLICDTAARNAFTEAMGHLVSLTNYRVQYQNHCSQPASSGSAGKSHLEVHPDQLL